LPSDRPAMIHRRRSFDSHLLKPDGRCVTDRAGALLIDILVLVREQIDRRGDRQQRDGCQSQDKYEFLPATSHLIRRNINRMAPDVANFLCRNGLTKENRGKSGQPSSALSHAC
jgi:hypothetical protein